MKTLNLSEIRKRDGRIEMLVSKLVNKTPFELLGNKKFSANTLIIYDSAKKKILGAFVPKKESDKEYRSAVDFLRNKAKSSDKVFISDGKTEVLLSQITKNHEFGGKGEGASLVAEDRAITMTRQAIENAIAENKGPISIRAGSKTYKNIVGVQKTAGTPKSDFELIDSTGASVIWISHKDGKKPSDFQQWGGISAKIEPLIHNHPETQKIIDDLKKVYPNGLGSTMAFSRHINDNKLKMISVYGNQYGGKLGPQNVTLLLQGPVGLMKKGTNYIMTANHVHYNGDSVDDGGFEPVFMAIYKGDRSDAGVKGTRIVIAPIGGRRNVDFPPL